MCMDDQFRERYSVADIRLHCEDYWKDGFSDLNTPEFAAHLDELIGLGVLTKDADNRYSVRSPNIVTMLGTRDQLETVLTEAEFELEHEYNPRSTRRPIQIGSATRRSPLSEHDLSELLPMLSRHEAGNFVIVGSRALGIEDVVPTLRSVAVERRIDIDVIDGGGHSTRSRITEFAFSGGGTRRPNLLIVNATEVEPTRAVELAETIRSLRKRSQGHLVLVYGVTGLNAASSCLEHQAVVPTKVISLDKWSGDGIRSWHDNPFRNDPGDRRQLLTATGGWPELVDTAVAEADRGVSNIQVWTALSKFPRTAEESMQFLAKAGVGADTKDLLATLAAYRLEDYEPLADIADVLEYDRDEMRALLTDLQLLRVVNERNDDYLLDPVIARALNTGK